MNYLFKIKFFICIYVIDNRKMKLSLTDGQLVKARNGNVFQLKPNQIGTHLPNHHNITFTELHPELARKFNTAMKKGSGCRCQLSRHEITGASLSSFLKGAWNTVKKVVNSNSYQKIVRPALRAATDLIPEPTLRKVVQQAGDATKAWGISNEPEYAITKPKKQRSSRGRVRGKAGSFQALG